MGHVASSRNLEYQAIGSNIYSANSGAKIIQFKLSTDMAWLDPTTVRIRYKITNTTPVVQG